MRKIFTLILRSFIYNATAGRAMLLVFLLGLLGEKGWGQVTMSATSSYTQNFDGLASSGTGVAFTDNSTISNWYSQRTGRFA